MPEASGAGRVGAEASAGSDHQCPEAVIAPAARAPEVPAAARTCRRVSVTGALFPPGTSVNILGRSVHLAATCMSTTFVGVEGVREGTAVPAGDLSALLRVQAHIAGVLEP